MSPANEAEQRWFAAHAAALRKLQAWCHQEAWIAALLTPQLGNTAARRLLFTNHYFPDIFL